MELEGVKMFAKFCELSVVTANGLIIEDWLAPGKINN